MTNIQRLVLFLTSTSLSVAAGAAPLADRFWTDDHAAAAGSLICHDDDSAAVSPGTHAEGPAADRRS